MPANEVWGKVIFSEACVKNSVHRGGGGFPAGIAGSIPACLAAGLHGWWYPSMPCRFPGPHPRGKLRGIWPGPPPCDGYCSGRYASYWNAYLLPPTNEVCEGYVFTGVCHSVHRGGGMRGCSRGGSVRGCSGEGMVAPRGHAWLLWGGVCGCSGGQHAWLLPGGVCMVAPRGVCMVVPGGGVHGCSWGGRAWFFR